MLCGRHALQTRAPWRQCRKADDHKKDSRGPALNISVLTAGTKDKGEEGNGIAKQERRILGSFKVGIQKLGSEWYERRDQKGGRRRRIQGKVQVPAGSPHR